MPRRRGNRRGGRRVQQRRALRGQHYTEIVTFSISSGTCVEIKRSDLKIPASRPFRVVSLQAQIAGPHIGGRANDQTSAYYSPGGVYIDMCSPSNQIVVSSRPTMLGPQPKTIWVRIPPSSDWFPPDTANNQKIATICHICLLKDATSVYEYITGIVHLHVALGQELPPATCPTRFTHLTSDESWADEVDREIPLQPRPGSLNGDTESRSSCPSVAIDFSFLDSDV